MPNVVDINLVASESDSKSGNDTETSDSLHWSSQPDHISEPTDSGQRFSNSSGNGNEVAQSPIPWEVHSDEDEDINTGSFSFYDIENGNHQYGTDAVNFLDNFHAPPWRSVDEQMATNSDTNDELMEYGWRPVERWMALRYYRNYMDSCNCL